MIQRIILILILALVTVSCGAPAATQAPVSTDPVATETLTRTVPPAFQSVEAPTRQTPTITPTPVPTRIIETPTDTALPTLDLPTEAPNAPRRMVWDGTPTYLGESTPGYSFRLTYDPELWALTTDQFGFPALGHRDLPGCVISVTSGRGLPLNMSVEHESLQAGALNFDVGRVYENGELKFVTYTGGNRIIVTGFQVDFKEESERCLADALAVLSSLTSVPDSQATPAP